MTASIVVNGETAPYIAEVCDNDPFYIAATISNRADEKDLTTPEGVRDALALETVTGKGEIARVWNEYLWDAFARVNDTNARKIVRSFELGRRQPSSEGGSLLCQRQASVNPPPQREGREAAR